jgi:UDP-MurNAc hydroxylase
VCDPWMGKANNGGWQSFPEYPVGDLAQHLSDARWVYVSHLHDDHLSIKTLQSLGLLDREFIIKKFQKPILRERLKKLGINKIHELEPFTVNQIGPFEITIFPQMTSNSSALNDDVNFDLDTSLLIRAEGCVFFNQVDNPFSTNDILKINEWIVDNYGEIDVACLMCGAASEYPQLFIGINQISEKKRIIDNSLHQIIRWLNILKPKIYFPAGGTYLIPGFLNCFSENIAQPTSNEIEKIIFNSNNKTKFISLEGGYSLETTKDIEPKYLEPEVIAIELNRAAAIKMHSKDIYDYQILDAPPFADLIDTLNTARQNWQIKIDTEKFKISQSITFKIYSNLFINNQLPDQKNLMFKYSLFKTKKSELGELCIHIDQRALFGCLTRKFIWNGVLGALCLHERKPNHHYPTDNFSINYFTI